MRSNDAIACGRGRVGSSGQSSSKPSVHISRGVRCLVVVGVQNDFFRGGKFPMVDVDHILGPLSQLRDAKAYDIAVVVAYWHPLNHSIFASTIPVRWWCDFRLTAWRRVSV